MTISFKNNSDVIVYAIEKIISYARDNLYIFLAQSIWWTFSIIRLQSELIAHIDIRHYHSENGPVQSRMIAKWSCDSICLEPCRQEAIWKEREEYLQDSKHLRDVANPKSTGKTKTGRINPLESTMTILNGNSMVKRWFLNWRNRTRRNCEQEAGRKASGLCLITSEEQPVTQELSSIEGALHFGIPSRALGSTAVDLVLTLVSADY